MNTEALFNFFSGAAAMAFMVVALFFLKYYRRSADGLFFLFSVAFFILAVERFITANYSIPESQIPLVYVFRMLAFTMIAAAIWRKNVGPRKSSVLDRD